MPDGIFGIAGNTNSTSSGNIGIDKASTTHTVLDRFFRLAMIPVGITASSVTAVRIMKLDSNDSSDPVSIPSWARTAVVLGSSICLATLNSH